MYIDKTQNHGKHKDNMAINPLNGYDRIAKFIASKPVQKIIRFADKNPALFQSATVFATASLFRPATIMGTPAKTEDRRKDNLYSASKSVASGITDLAFSTALFIPANKGINKISDKMFQNPKSLLYQDAKACKMYKNLVNRGLKIAVVPIIAYLNFKYLKNIANFISDKIIARGNHNENT